MHEPNIKPKKKKKKKDIWGPITQINMKYS